jgi:transcriptional regulator with XRE-family HTH domain
MSKELDTKLEKFYKIIGANVKKKRLERKLTQLQLSELMNFKSVGLVSQAEIYLKKQHFNLKHLYFIASILECDIEDFFEGVEITPLNWDIN